MKRCLLARSLVALLLLLPRPVRADADAFLPEGDKEAIPPVVVGILKGLDSAFPLLSPGVTISVKEIKEGRFRRVTLERRDARGRVVATLQAKDVEVGHLDLKTLTLRVFIGEGDFKSADLKCWFRDRVLQIPLFRSEE
jgi:hypothetical protein